jgi:hypothetical protein
MLDLWGPVDAQHNTAQMCDIHTIMVKAILPPIPGYPSLSLPLNFYN